VLGQLPYLCELEEQGIPTMLVDYADQSAEVKEFALKFGVPELRFTEASRTLPGPEDAARLIPLIVDGLTRPLTAREKKKGTWSPNSDRVIFRGTMAEGEEFFKQTKFIGPPTNAPIAVYTDGLPIVLPTEERVAEMLKGTSHEPDEVIALQTDGRAGKKGTEVIFLPLFRKGTVEKVAINAVMAGCKPADLPVVLAIAESGCNVGTTIIHSQWACVSGPIVKEIGMNSGLGMIGPGNPANISIGRALALMSINIGGAIPGFSRLSFGSPFNTVGTCFAEKSEGLPPGWKGLNEEHGFKKKESCVLVGLATGGFYGCQFSPGGYRSLQRSGHGGVARKLGVKGVPGPHNWLKYIVPDIWTMREGGFIFVMAPEMAKHLYDIGFKSKKEVYEWLYEQSFVPMSNYRNRSWVDEAPTQGWMGIEKTSGKHWRDLPDDYKVPLVSSPTQNCIIIAGGDEEVCIQIAGGRYIPDPHETDLWGAAAYSIDAWR
jgi:hypothetical protein